MTQEIIKRFAEQNGLSTIRAMVVLAELIGKREKSSTAMEPNVNPLKHILPQTETDAYADENTILLEV